MLELAEVIRALREELEYAMEASAEEALRFELGPVDVEMSVAVEAGASAEIKPRFVVISVGAHGSVDRTSIQRIKLTLTPRVGPAGRTPLVAGVVGERER